MYAFPQKVDSHRKQTQLDEGDSDWLKTPQIDM